MPSYDKCMQKKKVKVVNLFAGPGCGKSTGAAIIFALLKMMGVNAELVTEFAKDKTWEKNFKALDCQPYVFGKQVYRLDRCRDDVEIIITDSPLLLSILYNKDEAIEPSLTELVIKKFNEFENFNYLLKRVKPYNPKGRNQTEEESILIDASTKALLKEANAEFEEVSGSFEGYIKIVTDLSTYLGIVDKWEELKECLRNL